MKNTNRKCLQGKMKRHTTFIFGEPWILLCARELLKTFDKQNDMIIAIFAFPLKYLLRWERLFELFN